MLKTFLTQEEIILANTGMCCLLLPKNRADPELEDDPADLSYHRIQE